MLNIASVSYSGHTEQVWLTHTDWFVWPNYSLHVQQHRKWRTKNLVCYTKLTPDAHTNCVLAQFLIVKSFCPIDYFLPKCG